MIDEKFVKAAKMFLENRGYEIISLNNDALCQIVAKDNKELVFAQVKELPMKYNEAECSDKINEEQRFNLESFACDWYVNHPDQDNGSFRFDVIGFRVLGEKRAMVRHHINAFSLANEKIEESKANESDE